MTILRLKKSIITTAIATAALAISVLLATATASAAQTTVEGTAHDIASVGTPVCESCHVPHNASGDTLWAMTPSTDLSGQGSLCFSCHDGTVSDLGTYISDPTYKSHAVTEATEGQDCDRCHEPHIDAFKFIKVSLTASADMCASCHGTGGNTHPVNQTAGIYGPTDQTWDPYNATPDYSGTRLWNTAGTAIEVDGEVKCMTCHTPHGAVLATSLNSMAYSEAISTAAPLCANCH